VPFFIEKNQITAEPPDWLVTEIIKAMKSSDPYLAVEGIVAARSLKIYSLSDTLVGIYRKARMSFIGEMPLIHMSIIGCLTAFNNAQSRNALATIVSTPLPVKIANDIVPALKALGSIGDSSCISTLTALSTRLRSQEDSITTFQRANTMVAADTMQVNRLDQMIAAVNKAENMVLARGGSK
jgi:hypothetical protein